MLLSSASALLALLLPSVLAGGESSEPTSTQDKMKEGAQSLTDYDLSQLGLEKYSIGVILVVLGTYLTLFGKKFFKVFLAIIGFVAFGVAALYLLLILDDLWGFGENRRMIFYVVMILCACLGAGVSMVAWRVGVYAAAAAGGFFTGVFLMSIFAGITNHLSRQVFLTICTVATIVLVSFFDEMVIKAASSIVGAVLLMCGLDCFLEGGYNEVVLNMLYTKKLSMNPGVYGMLAGTAALAIGGFAFQTVYGGKGFGRKN
jgi:uncharacterized protein DUF4203